MIVPAVSYIATAHAVMLRGAAARLVDVQPDRPLIDPARIEEAISPRTRAIVVVHLNGAVFGRAEAGQDMTFDFTQLIAHAAKTRPLSAGSIIGSGTVSNKDADGGPGRPVDDGGRGYSCIAELRMIETIRDGAPKTPFMRFGDTVRIEMLDREGESIFGAIEQTVVRD